MPDLTTEALSELIGLNRILLNLTRSKKFPYGSPRHGYDLIAPLDAEGHIDPVSGRSIATIAGFADFGEMRKTRP